MHESVWNDVLRSISKTVDNNNIQSLFKKLKPFNHGDPTHFILSAPDLDTCKLLEKVHKENILSRAHSLCPSITSVSFIVTNDVSPSFTDLKNSFRENKYPVSFPQPVLNDRFSFNSFVVGSGNEFAKSASLAVAESPGKTKFNPLLIHGGVGLGKTHLLQAIGNYILSNNTMYRVTYITSEEFYLKFIDAIKNNNTKTFTASFRSSDALLMDDIHFFSGKESTQEEFFFIFNTLYQNGKQIVLTSDRSPGSLKGLQDRLISRFQWGLCVDIQPPNLETRVAILKKKAEEGNLNIPQNILYFIAENISSNIRELEGIIIRLFAYSSITNSDISIDLVKNILKSSKKREKARVTIDEIIEKVALYYKIPVNNIREKIRRKEVAHARQVAMFIAKTLTNNSLKTIGLNFGGRDHSTVVHAISHMEKLQLSDDLLSRDLNNIISAIEAE